MLLQTSRYAVLMLVACLIMPVASSHSLDFHGADVADSELPSSYLRIGLYGVRPVVNSVAHGAVAPVFQRGDVILAINGQAVRKSAELNRIATDKLAVTIFRGNEKKIVTVVRPVSEKIATSRAGTEKPLAPRGEDIYGTSAGGNSVKPVVAAAEVVAIQPDVHPLSITTEKSVSNSEIGGQQTLEPVLKPVVAPAAESARGAKEAEKVCVGGSEACVTEKTTITVVPAPAPERTGDFYNRTVKPTQDQIVFENKRGRVIFSHSVHLQSLNKVQCLLCHQTEKPTHESIQSRLDNHRAAHGFCRGCHQKTGRGPETECHRCHASSN
jgi:hypothetical protein